MVGVVVEVFVGLFDIAVKSWPNALGGTRTLRATGEKIYSLRRGVIVYVPEIRFVIV